MSEADFVKLINTAVKASGAGNSSLVEVERAVGVLKQLQEFDISRELLRKTNGGKTLKKLCHSDNKKISVAAKATINTWKARVASVLEKESKDYLSKNFPTRSESIGMTSERLSPLRSEGHTVGNSTADRLSQLQDASSHGKLSIT